MKTKYGLLTLLLLILTLLPAQAQTLASYRTYLIPPVEVDPQNSTLSVRFFVDQNGITIRDLTADSISLSEDASDLQLTASSDRSLTIAVLVDLSFGSDADLIQGTLRAFFDAYYVQGDQVTLYVLDAASASDQDVRVIPITSLDEARSAIDALALSERLFIMQHALDRAFADLTALPDDPLQSRQVLYISSLINRPEDAAETTRFAEAGILVHGVQAHRTRESQTALFRDLVANGGGLFANNFEGLLVIPGDRYQPINNLKVLYDMIANNRLVYTLRYRTASKSLEANRPVNLTITLPSGAVVESSFTYQWDFQPPVVTFASARDFSIARTPFLQDDGSVSFEPQARTVPVQVTFPDGVSRAIESARLEVLDSATGTVLQSALLMQPQLNADQTLTLEWALTDYSVQGSNRDIELVVTLTDELGLSGAVSTVGSVQVAVLPPTPTPPPTATPIPTATPQPSPTPPALPAQSAASTLLDRQPNLILIGANIALILLVLILLLRTRRLRNAQLAAAQPANTLGHVVRQEANTQQRTWPSDYARDEQAAPEPVAPAAQQSAPEMIGQYKLVLAKGHEQMPFREVIIDSTEFVIGRIPECNLVMDLPTISNRHCAIRLDPRRGIFVRDLGSVNGTYINGDRLHSGDESFVPLGSEIWVTKAHVFEIWDADKQIHLSKEEEQAKLSTLYISADAVVFKPLPGLRYVPDDGGPIDDDYAPV